MAMDCTIPINQIIESQWHGCYDGGWNGLIVPEAFAHPAKFAHGLILRIIDHGLSKGYWRAGDMIGDPFGGVALGGVIAGYYGLNWIGVELEPRFVKLGNQNLDLHRVKWAALGYDVDVRLVQGDSRRFASLVGAVSGCVTSPPYAETPVIDVPRGNAGCASGGIGTQYRLGNRPKGAAKFANGQSGQNYGSTPGNLGNLKAGSVDVVVTSPPFLGARQGTTKSSPTRGGGPCAERIRSVGTDGDCMGDSPGQMGNLSGGRVDAVCDGIITSPPFMDSVGNAAGAPDQKTIRPYLPPAEDVAAYLRKCRLASGLTCKKVDIALGTKTLYSWYEGRPAGIEIPTPEHYCKLKKILGLDDRYDHGVLTEIEVEATGRRTTSKTGHAKIDIYGKSAGQIGAINGETYWQAMRSVYAQMHLTLKPGGVAAIVVKDYVKAGKRVPLCDDTLKLLVGLGFEPLERVHAMLVKETQENTLFDGQVTKTKSRKSFFRNLAEKKGSPRIDWEEVLFVAKS